MVLTGLAVLFVGNGMARCDLVPSAYGSSSSSTTPQITSGTTPINITSTAVNGSSGIYDVNSVVYLTNTSASTQMVTAQYTVGGVTVGTPFSLSLATGASQTVSLPQQLAAQAGSAAIGLQITDLTGGVGNTVTVKASSLTVTGYANNVGAATVSGPGSSTLPTTTNPSASPVIPVSVASVGVAASQGLIGVNSALVINNASGSIQQVSATYTVDGVASGSSFTMTLPGSGSTLVALPSQLAVAAGTTHNIGIQITDIGGSGISIGAGSTISATAFNNSNGAPSATGVTAANQNLGNQNLIFSSTLNVVGVTVPPVGTNGLTYYDANASILLSSTSAIPYTFTAQYMDGTTALGPIFTITLPGNGLNGSVGTFSLPEQFSAATLTAGSSLSVLLTSVGSSSFNIDADSISLVAHNYVATPEPASLSLAAMAAMAFGAAAYRKRRSSKVLA